MSILKKIFGIKSTDYNQLMKDGGIVIDVRTPRFNFPRASFFTGYIPLNTA